MICKYKSTNLNISKYYYVSLTIQLNVSQFFYTHIIHFFYTHIIYAKLFIAKPSLYMYIRYMICKYKSTNLNISKYYYVSLTIQLNVSQFFYTHIIHFFYTHIIYAKLFIAKPSLYMYIRYMICKYKSTNLNISKYYYVSLTIQLNVSQFFYTHIIHFFYTHIIYAKLFIAKPSLYMYIRYMICKYKSTNLNISKYYYVSLTIQLNVSQFFYTHIIHFFYTHIIYAKLFIAKPSLYMYIRYMICKYKSTNLNISKYYYVSLTIQLNVSQFFYTHIIHFFYTHIIYAKLFIAKPSLYMYIRYMICKYKSTNLNISKYYYVSLTIQLNVSQFFYTHIIHFFYTHIIYAKLFIAKPSLYMYIRYMICKYKSTNLNISKYYYVSLTIQLNVSQFFYTHIIYAKLFIAKPSLYMYIRYMICKYKSTNLNISKYYYVSLTIQLNVSQFFYTHIIYAKLFIAKPSLYMYIR